MPTKQLGSRRYVTTLGFVVGIVCAVTLAVNAIIDPYAMTDWVNKPGFNSHKAALIDHTRIGKPLAVMRKQPKLLLMGISREARGFDLGSAAWGDLPTPRYNLALDSGHIRELRDFYEHAANVAPIQELVIGLDFLLMFDARYLPQAYDPRLLVLDGQPRLAVHWRALQYLMSFDTLRDAIATVSDEPHSVVEFDEFGSRTDTALQQQPRRAGGQRNMFRFSESHQYFDNQIRMLLDRPFTTDSNGYSTLADLGMLLDRAARDKVRVTLVIPPVHARQLEVYRLLGLWPAYEQWKQDVLSVASGKQHRQADDDYPVWDFTTYHPITWENVPAKGDVETQMQYYWESSHFKRALGDQVLQRIFGTGPVADGFGVRLSAATFDAHSAATRQRGEQYRATHADDLTELHELLCASYRGLKQRFPKLNPATLPSFEQVLSQEAQCK